MTRNEAREKRPSPPAWYWTHLALGVVAMVGFAFEWHKAPDARWLVIFGIGAASALAGFAGLRLFAPVTAERFAAFLQAHCDRLLAFLSPACLVVALALFLSGLFLSPHHSGLSTVGWMFFFLQKSLDDLRGKSIFRQGDRPQDVPHVTPQPPRL